MKPIAPSLLIERRWTLAVTGILWVAGVWGAGRAAAQVVGTSANPSVAVPVAVVGTHAVGQGLVLDGSLQAVRQSTLSAQASGRIMQLGVKAGDRVKAGQVLAVIDDRVSQAGVSQAQAQVAQADANLTNAKAQFQRTQELHAKGFVSKSALDVAESQYKAAAAGASGAQAGQTQSQLAQGFTRITAPYDGWVLSTQAEPGDLALPGTPVLTVYAPQPMRAVTHVPASRQAQAQAAKTIEIRLPDGSWTQPVARTALPAADPVSQTVEWRLDLDANAAAAWLPGQQVQVRFVNAQADKLTVPAEAVFRRGELTAVYVAAPVGSAEGFVLRAVRLGASHGSGGHEVLAGLRPGEKVALDPVRAGLAGARPASKP